MNLNPFKRLEDDQPQAFLMGPAFGEAERGSAPARTGQSVLDDLVVSTSELRSMSPLVRAKLSMEAGERSENAKAAFARDKAAVEREGAMVARQQADRAEVIAFGRTVAEMANEKRVAEEVRQAKIAEHMSALAKLDPGGAGRVARSAGYGDQAEHLVTMADGYVMRLDPRPGPSAREVAETPGATLAEREQRAAMLARVAEYDARVAARGPSPTEEALRRHALGERGPGARSGTGWPASGWDGFSR